MTNRIEKFANPNDCQLQWSTYVWAAKICHGIPCSNSFIHLSHDTNSVDCAGCGQTIIKYNFKI